MVASSEHRYLGVYCRRRAPDARPETVSATPNTDPKIWVLALLLWFWWSWGAFASEPLVQKMRLPIGTYWIESTTGGSGGGSAGPHGTSSSGVPPFGSVRLERARNQGFRLPAYCIDYHRAAPRSLTPMTKFSGTIIVKRFLNGAADGERSLSDAIGGSHPWLAVTGETFPNRDEGSPYNLTVTPTDPTASYAISVDGMALAGADDVAEYHKQWTGNPELMRIAHAFDVLREILLKGPIVDADALEELEEWRQQYEWAQFGDADSGAIIPTSGANPNIAARSIERFVGGLQREASSHLKSAVHPAMPDSRWLDMLPQPDLQPHEISNRLALTRGAALSSTEYDALTSALNAVGLNIPAAGLPEDRHGGALLKAFASYSAASRALTAELYGTRAEAKAKLVPSTQYASLTAIKSEGKLPLTAVLRQESYKILDSTEMTSGRIELAWLRFFHCSGANDSGQLITPDQETDIDKTIRNAFLSSRDLLKELDAAPVTYLSKRTAKITVLEGKACLEWFGPDGHVFREIMPLNALTRAATTRLGLAKLVYDHESEELPNLGTKALHPLASLAALRRQAAAQAMRARRSKKSLATDFERRSYRLGRTGSGHRETVEIGVLNLDPKGDGIVVRAPDGSFILIDTGYDKRSAGLLRTFLNDRYHETNPRIRLVLTHAHADHIGGLAALKDAGFFIEEIIVGRSANDPKETDNVLRSVGIPSVIPINGVTHHYFGSEGAIFDPNAAGGDGAVSSWLGLNLGGMDISIHHVDDALQPNDGGLMVKLSFHGMSYLFTDDLSATALKAMVDNLEPEELQANFLKWPHHAWLPTKKGEKITLDRFLKVVSPNNIVLSNIGYAGHRPTSSTKRDRQFVIQGFVNGSLDRGVRIDWTKRHRRNVVYVLSDLSCDRMRDSARGAG